MNHSTWKGGSASLEHTGGTDLSPGEHRRPWGHELRCPTDGGHRELRNQADCCEMVSAD